MFTFEVGYTFLQGTLYIHNLSQIIADDLCQSFYRSVWLYHAKLYISYHNDVISLIPNFLGPGVLVVRGS